MTINEAIYSVFEGAGISTDDFPVRKRFVYRELRNARTELIKQELNKNKLLTADTAQSLICFPLERADASTCLDCQTGLFVLRSKDKVPKMIESDFGVFVEVYLQNGVMIPKIMRSDWLANLKRRYQLPNFSGCMFINEHIIIVGYEDIDELIVDVSGYFDQPEEVHRLNRKHDDNCAITDKCLPLYEYPFECPGYLSRRVIEIARAVVFRRMGIPLDQDNNAKSDSYVQGKTQPAS